MRIQSVILSLSLFLFSFSALAGAGHDHGGSQVPVTQAEAEKVATRSIQGLVEAGKIDSSWNSVQIAESLKKTFGGNMEWVISFKNKNISELEKQNLYVFLTLSGEYLGANYTGD
ncbi:MAG: hypothetical protein ACI9KN_000746 [Gammaproteobacteria bacterium]|jgi:hypothetical protein